MPHSRTVDALILRTFDVGEADRSCILFTRELGRVFARASGVRKLKSRMGGSLLPFQHAQVQLKESGAGYIVAGVNAGIVQRRIATLAFFTEAQRGIEVLLAVTQSGEPLPEVFDATVAFLQGCGGPTPHLALRYTLCLLHLLGFLPEAERIEAMAPLSMPEWQFIGSAMEADFATPRPIESADRLENLCRVLLEDQLSVRLRAGEVVGRM